MHDEETNEYGCPLRNQTGVSSIVNFFQIIARLTPEQREAFRDERAAREAELELITAAYGYNT